ncbi:MAG: protein TonB [Cyclobacteriaceae bacterium]
MEEDKKYKRIGWITSVSVQMLMLLLFYLLIAWKEPFPPIPTYGIELNFGFSEAGLGDEPVENTQEELPIEEEIVEEVLEEVEQIDETEVIIEETTIPEVVETPIEEAVFEDITSPDVVEPEKTKVQKEVKEVETKKEVKKIEPEKVIVEKKPAETKPVQPVKEEALMPTTDTGTKSSSQGTSAPAGDEGKEEGSLEGRALYGSQGSADGASLQMAGWTWDFKPEPNDKSLETGKIVYQIVIDSEGYFSRIDVVSSTVSPDVERIYRQSVERLSYSKTDDYKPAPSSTGRVTFIIKAK